MGRRFLISDRLLLTTWVGTTEWTADNHETQTIGGDLVKAKVRVVKQLYRLNVEPRVVDQLSKLASRTGEPKSRLATRLFTEAVMGFKPAGRK
jgi:hypothetical protein